MHPLHPNRNHLQTRIFWDVMPGLCLSNLEGLKALVQWQKGSRDTLPGAASVAVPSTAGETPPASQALGLLTMALQQHRQGSAAAQPRAVPTEHDNVSAGAAALPKQDAAPEASTGNCKSPSVVSVLCALHV